MVGAILPDVVDLPFDHQTWGLVICKDGNVEQVSVKVTEDLKETGTTEHDGVGLPKTHTVSLIIWYDCEYVREERGGRVKRKKEKERERKRESMK